MKWRGGLVITVWGVWEETVGPLRHKNLCKNLTGAFSVYSTILKFLNFSITSHHFFRKKKKDIVICLGCVSCKQNTYLWMSQCTNITPRRIGVHPLMTRWFWKKRVNHRDKHLKWDAKLQGQKPEWMDEPMGNKKKKSILTFGIATPGVLLLFFILKNDALPLYALRLQKGGTPPFASPV